MSSKARNFFPAAAETKVDAMDEISVNTDFFSVDERLEMCAEAIKLFSNTKFEFDRRTRPGACRAYKLVDNSRSEYVRAFECPTTPTLLIQVTGDEIGGYSAWAIIKKKKKKKSKPSSITSTYIEDMPYNLLYVDDIVDRK